MTEVCVVTYDSSIQFYQVPQAEGGEPTIISVGDVQEPFVPLPFSKLMLNVAEDREQLESLIDKIYNMYSAEESIHSGQSVNYCATGAAIKAAFSMLEEVGKFLIQSNQ